MRSHILAQREYQQLGGRVQGGRLLVKTWRRGLIAFNLQQAGKAAHTVSCNIYVSQDIQSRQACSGTTLLKAQLAPERPRPGQRTVLQREPT